MSAATKTGGNGKRKLTPLESMKVYEKFRDFRNYVYRVVDKMPHWVKRSDGAECIKAIKACIRHLSVVSRTYDKEVKIKSIDAFLEEWDVVFDSIYFFHEVQGISHHQFEVMALQRDEIEGQVSALRLWLVENSPKGGELPKI